MKPAATVASAVASATPKAKIPKKMRQLVWNRYIGQHRGTGHCWCCRSTQIDTFTFECGHVVAEADGGTLSVENLRPICGLCNRSMGTKNMVKFQLDNGMQPSALSRIWESVARAYYSMW